MNLAYINYFLFDLSRAIYYNQQQKKKVFRKKKLDLGGFSID